MEGFGVFIHKGPADWQILQHRGGTAKTSLEGTWQIRPDFVEFLTQEPAVVVRLMREDDNMQMVPWQPAQTTLQADKMGGIWSLSFTMPAGGLYRLETGIDLGIDPGRVGTLRGDVRLHLGVGNVFVIAGQSNAAGYGHDNAWDPPMCGVHLLRNCGRWDLATHPMNESTDAASAPNAEGFNSGTSPYLSFGKMIQRLTGLPVGLLATALGGSPIRRWVIAQEGDLYRNMVRRIHAANSSIAGVLWYQGCSDTDTAEQASAYLDNFTEMVQDLRAELECCVPFFTFQLNRHINSPNDAYWGIVKDLQRRAAQTIEKVFILPTSDCSLADLIHNKSGANVMLGERLARQCAAVLCGGPAWFAPDLASAVQIDRTIRLAFDHVSFGFENFNHDPNECFSIKDDTGTVPVTAWRFHGASILLDLARETQGPTCISFGANSNPVQPPVCDSVTYLPILSFFNFPVQTQLQF
jgi:sialate O-acetylesterase